MAKPVRRPEPPRQLLRLVAKHDGKENAAPGDVLQVFVGRRLVATLSPHTTGNILTPVVPELEPLRGRSFVTRDSAVLALNEALGL